MPVSQVGIVCQNILLAGEAGHSGHEIFTTVKIYTCSFSRLTRETPKEGRKVSVGMVRSSVGRDVRP